MTSVSNFTLRERIEAILLDHSGFIDPNETAVIQLFSLLQEVRRSDREKLKKNVRDFLEGWSKKTFETTMLGKNSPLEVTKQEWQDCSFSFDDILNVIDSVNLDLV